MSDLRVTDKVVGVAFAAFTFDKFAHPVQAMRSALEAAVPLLAPQPVVERDALIKRIMQVTDRWDEPIGNGEAAELAHAVLGLLNGTPK